MTMRAGQGQTLIDIALERSGRVSDAWVIAESLGVSLTDLVEGSDVGVLEVAKNKQVVRSYVQGRTHPATELTDGIGGWRIGVFIIS